MSTVDLSRFSASDIKEVTNWTLLVRAMIGSNPDEHPEIMKAAIDEITEMVNDRWPLETGGSLVIDPEAMETDLSDCRSAHGPGCPCSPGSTVPTAPPRF
jgi:hypothetical protein